MSKTVYFVMGLLLISGVPVSAHTASGGRVGIKAGPVFSSFWGDTEEADFRNRTGFYGGIEMAFPLGAGFAIQPEILYVQKGATADRIENDRRFDVNFRVDYIEIPLLISITTPTEGRLHGRFYIGPFVAALLRDEIDGTYAGIPLPENHIEELRPDDGFSPVDGGGIIGAGVLFHIAGQTALILDVRLAVSAVPLVPDNNDFIANRSVSVSLGLAL